MEDRSVLPDALPAFESKESWRTLSNSALSRFDPRRLFRGIKLGALDRKIAKHAKEHAKLTAQYNKQRENYARASQRYSQVISPSEDAVNAIAEVSTSLAEASRTFDQLVESRKDIQREFGKWMNDRVVVPELNSSGGERRLSAGRNRNGELSGRQMRIADEMRSVRQGQETIRHESEKITRSLQDEIARLDSIKMASAEISRSRTGRDPRAEGIGVQFVVPEPAPVPARPLDSRARSNLESFSRVEQKRAAPAEQIEEAPAKSPEPQANMTSSFEVGAQPAVLSTGRASPSWPPPHFVELEEQLGVRGRRDTFGVFRPVESRPASVASVQSFMSESEPVDSRRSSVVSTQYSPPISRRSSVQSQSSGEVHEAPTKPTRSTAKFGR